MIRSGRGETETNGNYRWARGMLVVAATFSLLFAVSIAIGLERHRAFDWFVLVMLLVGVVWTIRMAGNVVWLRRVQLETDVTPTNDHKSS